MQRGVEPELGSPTWATDRGIKFYSADGQALPDVLATVLAQTTELVGV